MSYTVFNIPQSFFSVVEESLATEPTSQRPKLFGWMALRNWPKLSRTSAIKFKSTRSEMVAWLPSDGQTVAYPRDSGWAARLSRLGSPWSHHRRGGRRYTAHHCSGTPLGCSRLKAERRRGQTDRRHRPPHSSTRTAQLIATHTLFQCS